MRRVDIQKLRPESHTLTVVSDDADNTNKIIIVMLAWILAGMLNYLQWGTKYMYIYLCIYSRAKQLNITQTSKLFTVVLFILIKNVVSVLTIKYIGVSRLESLNCVHKNVLVLLLASTNFKMGSHHINDYTPVACTKTTKSLLVLPSQQRTISFTQSVWCSNDAM